VTPAVKLAAAAGVGLAAAVAAAEAARPVAQLRLAGTVDTAAEARRTTAGDWLLHLQLVLPAGDTRARGKPVTVVGVKPYGRGEAAAQACAHAARWLRHGSRVVVHATAARMRGARLEALGIDAIEMPDVPSYMRAG
jgi:poly(3-hydroxybutyrate) depolymerase